MKSACLLIVSPSARLLFPAIEGSAENLALKQLSSTKAGLSRAYLLSGRVSTRELSNLLTLYFVLNKAARRNSSLLAFHATSAITISDS